MIEGGGGGSGIPIPESVSSNTPERWIAPHQAIINSPDGRRSVDISPSFRPILSKEGQQLGQVLEETVEVNPGDQQASLDFVFKKDSLGHYYAITNGAQSWSSSVGKVGHNADQMVGMRPLEKSLGGKTVPFYDPGPGGQKIPGGEGRSYGWVDFRDGEFRENLFLGVIPGFDSLESIRYRQEGDNMVISVIKNLEGVSTNRSITFKVFLGSGDPRRTASSRIQYADLALAFSRELSKSVDVPLMQDRAIGFSWPVYGKEVAQADVLREVTAGKGILDTYIIDAGCVASGSLEVNKAKFPDLDALIQQTKEAEIKPGIWVAPFMIAEADVKKLEKEGILRQEWLMRDQHGKPRRIPLPGITGLFERSFMLDISNPDVRKYLNGKLVGLAKAGFEVFKADFLMVPFTGQLQNKGKTSVEYYREFFEKFRQSVRDQLNKEIEIIGCGAPVMESIGLFDGMRMTGDSSVPLETFAPFPNIVKRLTRTQLIGGKVNTELYSDAVAAGGRKTLPLNGSYGLIWDGIHITDEDIPLNPDQKERKNKSLLALNRLGVNNLFVGDSLAKAGEEGKAKWRNFIGIFKKGNVDLVFGDSILPKIKEKYLP